MVKTRESEYMPVVAIPPGETIRENIDAIGMTQVELAARLGITPKHMSNIITGAAPITYETALNLETVIGPSAEFWMNLESNYQLDKARLKELDELSVDLEIIREIPYNEMSKNGWIEPTRDKTKKILNSRSFFSVAGLSLIQNSYNVSFRQGKNSTNISDYGVLAWLRKAEIEGTQVEVETFDKTKLRKLIPTFRSLTLEEPRLFYPKMKKLCAECGIALVLVESLPNTNIYGATIWRNDKAILALSVRGKKADIFWFTFFHELAHLIHHGRKEFHINFDNDRQEDEADKIASNYLLSQEEYKEFVDKCDYRNKISISRYAKQMGISPCILVGRLQHDGLIDYKNYNDLRPSFEIVRKISN